LIISKSITDQHINQTRATSHKQLLTHPFPPNNMPTLRSASSSKVLSSTPHFPTHEEPLDEASHEEETQPTGEDPDDEVEEDQPTLKEVLAMPTFKRLQFAAGDGSLQRVIEEGDW
jgi:hypothetical protein